MNISMLTQLHLHKIAEARIEMKKSTELLKKFLSSVKNSEWQSERNSGMTLQLSQDISEMDANIKTSTNDYLCMVEMSKRSIDKENVFYEFVINNFLVDKREIEGEIHSKTEMLSGRYDLDGRSDMELASIVLIGEFKRIKNRKKNEQEMRILQIKLGRINRSIDRIKDCRVESRIIWSSCLSGRSAIGKAFNANSKTEPSQTEGELRERIQDYCKSVDALFFGRQWGEANKRVGKTFGMSPAHMPLETLQKAKMWLEEYFPLDSMMRK